MERNKDIHAARDRKLDNRQLEEISYRMSREIIEMTTKAGSGHPSSSLSIIDILTVLFFGGFMRYDASQPQWPDRDRFILSKGHASPGLYVALAQAGYFDPALLSTLREFGSPLEGHPVMQRLAGVEASTGSLGQGLSIGLGHLLAGRVDKRDYRVYVIIGDGEANEGQIWEAAMAAAKYKADRLTAILDFNRFQQTGPMEEVMPSMRPVVDKWKAFDWEVFEINGHDIGEISTSLKAAQEVRGKPQMIVAHTHKGKLLSPFEKEAQTRMHGATLSEEEAQTALIELEAQYEKRSLKEAGPSVTKGR
jgi:transketolase